MHSKLLFLLLLAGLAAGAQPKEDAVIRQLLQTQTAAWNRGDIEGFMQTYWHSDSLLFIGKSGVHYGWQSTLENYRRGYPDSTAMGKLSFDIIELRRLSADHYYLVGKWMLARQAGDLSGHFDLLIRRIRGRWLIVADHSS